MEFLQNFDIFGTPITFKIMDNERYHSPISVSLSIIIIIVTILFTYFFGLDFIFHLEPNVLQSIRANKTYDFYNLTMEEFFVAWQIEGTFFEEANITNILYPSVGYYSYKTGYNNNQKYQKCKNYNLSFNIPNDIKEYFCIDMSKYSQGGGHENKNIIEFLYINIDLCGKRTNGVHTCSNNQDFQSLINYYGGVNLVLYYPTISFIPDEDIPYQINYNKKTINLDYKMTNVNQYYIQKYIVEDDNGWIIPKINTYKLFGISDIDTSYAMNEKDEENRNKMINSNNIFYGTFYIDRRYSYYKRSFTKLFESLPIIIAFYKTVYVLFCFISSFCNEFLLLETIMVNNRGNFIGSHRFNMSNVDNFSNAILSKCISNKNSKFDFSKKSLKFLDNSNSNNNILVNNNIIKSVSRLSKFNKKNELFFSENNNFKKEFSKNNSKKMKNAIRLNLNASNNKSIYRLLFLYIFHFFLSENKKHEYQINLMNRRTFKKKLDVFYYLNLLRRVDLLFIQLQKRKIENKT